jgi:hypothetical protein
MRRKHMGKINIGDIIRIKNRPDWPSPPGYKLADSEGEVTSLKEEEGFVTIRLLKTNSNIPKDAILDFRLENVVKI